MENQVYVGLDYHQSGVQACVLDERGAVLLNRWCANDCRTLMAIVDQAGPVRRAAIESCPGAADLADELIAQAGWSVELAHPGYVARMKRGPDKTDFSDARVLAELTRVNWLPRVWLAPETVRELRRLTRHRQSLVDERRAAKLRIRAVLREKRRRCAHAPPWTLPWLVWLEREADLGEQSRWVVTRLLAQTRFLDEEVRATEARLRAQTRHDPVTLRLLEQPGVGRVTAWTLRAEIGWFGRFASGKQLARFCGLSPRNASSGERQADSGLIRASSPALRALLIEAGHRLTRGNSRWRTLADHLRAAGKHPCVIAAAVANRWVRWLYHQMKETQAA